MTEEKGNSMAKKEENKPKYTKTLVRTVSHYDERENEYLLNVTTNVLEHPMPEESYEHVAVEDPSGEYKWIFINSEAQAIELFRAIKAAGKEIGWFEND